MNSLFAPKTRIATHLELTTKPFPYPTTTSFYGRLIWIPD